jgi:hypothetical protein
VKRTTWTVILGLIATAGWCQEVDMTSGELLERCRQPADTSASGYCAGYTTGIADTLARTGHICVLPGVKRSEFRDIVVTYMNGHPDDLHSPAAYLARVALEHEFPCQGKHRK